MAGNTKALRVRMRSVSSTLQLTKAMELVASSKIRRANEAMLAARAYEASLDKVIGLFCANTESLESPYVRKRGGERTRLIVIAGDRGLAGGYNANAFRLAAEYPGAEILPIGKRACDRYGSQTISSEAFTFQSAYTMAQKLCRDFRNGEFDRLGILYTRYRSVITQEATVKWVLPLSSECRDELAGAIFEPDLLTALDRAVLEYVAGKITASVRESFASEVSARRMAMDSAGKNAKQMIDDLQLAYNRARQGAITQEITEIVAGAGTD